MRPAFAQVATENIIKLAEFTRQVVYRAQLFVNYYITDNYETTTGHPYLYEQNFWYSICKLILGKRVRNRQYMGMSVTLAFDDFKSKFPTIVYSLKTHPVKGYSDSLAAACVTLATTYSNFIVENFENRLKHYARTCLKHLFPVSHDRIHNNCSSRVFHEVLFILCSRSIRKEKSTESSTNTASKR
ncbi:hypothetical protein BDF20DRAFT_825415 [Mycotypha africana]|uniref:uncharacterized protein n=1 Tax=Mycotypha africana TaxID=64632 RepID=UPI0022FFFC65|nr:uncharacterized protein BDF20DRAFT_825415 [Mycotypha africana]KAI8971607.1 hypothetical protein BDF20DRAFT_825415 [Mycotypha africana]